MLYHHELVMVTTNVVAGLLIVTGTGLLPLAGLLWFLIRFLLKKLSYEGTDT